MYIREYHIFGEIWQQHLHSYPACFFDAIFPKVAQPDGDEARLDTIIHLPEWPASSGKKKPRSLDILVHARESFTLSSPHRILESNIKVTYWKVDRVKKIAEHLSTVHYDYDRDPRRGHPVYHCQCCNDPVSDGRFPSSWQFKQKLEAERSCFPFRVPTPHMCLCSVLIGLVADHLPPGDFKELWKAIKKKGWIPPLTERCELWNQGRAKANPRVLHSWQWYFWPECDS